MLAVFLFAGFASGRAYAASEEDRQQKEAYAAAEQLEEQGNTVDACLAFFELGDYQDSALRAEALKQEAYYQLGLQAIREGRYASACEDLLIAGDYADAAEKAYLAGASRDAEAMEALTESVAKYCFYGEWGIANFDTGIMIHPTWSSVELIADEYLLTELGGAYGLADLNGTVIFPCEYAHLELISDRILLAETSEGLFGLLDLNGTIPVQPIWSAYKMTGDKIIFTEKAKYGLASAADGSILLSAIYDDFRQIGTSNLVHVEKDGLHGLVSLEGTVITECKWAGISDEPIENVFLVAEESSNQVLYGMIGIDGNAVFSCDYVQLGCSGAEKSLQAGFSSGRMACRTKNGLWGYLGPDGSQILPVYAEVHDFINDYAAVRTEDGWGFLLPDGTWAIEAKYLAVTDFNDSGLALGKMQNGQYRYLTGSEADTYYSDSRYEQARDLEANGELDAALAIYDTLGNYDDCARRAAAIRYSYAEAAFAEENFEDALNDYLRCGDYKDAIRKAEICQKEPAYRKAVQQKEGEYYASASASFEALGDYKDSIALKQECDTILANRAAYEKAAQLAAEEDYTGAMELFLSLGDFEDAAARASEMESLLEGKYSEAEALMQSEQYEEAIAILEGIEDYKDSAEKKQQCEKILADRAAYASALVLFEKEDYESALELFNSLGDYEEAAAYSSQIQTILANKAVYAEAETLLAEENYDEALALFTELGDFEDAAARAAEVQEIIDNLFTYEVGDTLFFGSYEQDNDLTNGAEPIEWIVLDTDKDEKKVKVISKYGLDCQPYNTTHVATTWEICTLRSWLNDSFLNSAFNEEEQSSILLTDVSSDNNPKYKTDPGNETRDYIFLLSTVESEQYFETDVSRQCEATAYAKDMGASIDKNGYSWWWLRTPGSSSGVVSDVRCNGGIGYMGNVSYSIYGVVRPVMWINLKH